MADKDAVNQKILKEILIGWGALVREAVDAKQAIAELNGTGTTSDPFKIILLDYNMLGLGEFMTVLGTKANSCLNSKTIIMLNPNHKKSDILKIRDMGIDASLIKPLNRSELLNTINAVMGLPFVNKETIISTKPSLGSENFLPLRILLVEDSRDNRLLLQAFLNKTPFLIEEAENGMEGLEKFKSEKFDLVLMDMQMPVMDGYTAVREIRNWEKQRA